MRQTILLTGATGFLGSHLLEFFVQQKKDVLILKRTTSDTWRINHLLDKVRVCNIDKVDFKTIFSEQKVDLIINTVCSYGRKNESLIDIVSSNLIFGLNLLEEAIKNNVKTFINTDSLLPRNLNDYSLSKAQFRDWLYKRSKNIQVVNLKIEHMYGPKDDSKKFLPWLIKEMVNGKGDINLTSGIQKRDFIYIDDVVKAFDIVISKKDDLPSWSEYDIGTNKFTYVKDFVLIVANELGKLNKIEILPRLKLGIIPYREADIMIPELDNSRLVELGWRPETEVYSGIIKTIKKNYD